MNCEHFKRAYNKFDGAKNVIHWRDTDTPEYHAYSDHMQDCHSCRDWFQTEQLTEWKVDPNMYPCIHMAFHANLQCGNHEDPRDCPSILVIYLEHYDEYGIPSRDGGESYWKIDHCPWCGIALPDSKREQWMRKLRALGFDPIKDIDRVPEIYKTSRWYRDGGNPNLRLV